MSAGVLAGDDDADPRRHGKAWNRLGNRRNVREDGEALRLGHGEGSQLAGVHVLQKRLHVVETHLHLTADERERSGARAFVRGRM